MQNSIKSESRLWLGLERVMEFFFLIPQIYLYYKLVLHKLKDVGITVIIQVIWLVYPPV